MGRTLNRTWMLTLLVAMIFCIVLGLNSTAYAQSTIYISMEWSPPGKQTRNWWDQWNHITGYPPPGVNNQNDHSNWHNPTGSSFFDGATVLFDGESQGGISLFGGSVPSGWATGERFWSIRTGPNHGLPNPLGGTYSEPGGSFDMGTDTITYGWSGYRHTDVGDMYIMSGAYQFHGGFLRDYSTGMPLRADAAIDPVTKKPVHTPFTLLDYDPDQTKWQYATLFGNQYDRLGEYGTDKSTGKLYLQASTGANNNIENTFFLETNFYGGVVFDQGRVVLRHNKALGTWENIDFMAVPGSTQKRDNRGLVDVRGNRAEKMQVTLGSDGAPSRDIQTRFVVSQGRVLEFMVPYFGVAAQNPVFTISKVDTHNYSDAAGKSLPGGAIYLGEGATMTHIGNSSGSASNRPGELFFNNNTAVRGGAIYATNNLTITGNTRFENNKAIRNIVISDPEANTGFGGAIYMLGSGTSDTLELNVSSGAGDILFRGNTATAFDGTVLDSAIFLAKNTELSITGNRYVYFEDAISSRDPASPPSSGNETGENNSMTVNLLTTPTLGNGFVQFASSGATGGASNSVLNATGKAGGQVDVESGEFRIVAGTTFATYGNNSIFKVLASTGVGGNRGGILAGAGLIKAEGGFKIYGTISPDSYTYAVPNLLTGMNTQVPIPTDKLIGTLKLSGSVSFDTALFKIDNSNTVDIPGILKSDRIVVDKGSSSPGVLFNSATNGMILLADGANRSTVQISTWITGNNKYVIATATDGIFDTEGNIPITNKNIMEYFKPVELAGSQQLTGRKGASLYVERDLLSAGNEYDIVLNTSESANLYLVWYGDKTNVWENSGVAGGVLNWRSTRSNDPSTFDTQAEVALLEQMYFKDGDYIYFNNVAQRTTVQEVMINDPITVSGMEILDGNSYVFRGDKIVGDTADVTGVVATGKLRITGANTRVQISNVTEFYGGTELSNGATIIMMHNESLGRYDSVTEEGVVVLTPYIDNNGFPVGNGNGTIIAGEAIQGAVQNHFRITDGSSINNIRTLTLQIDDQLVVRGVDTSANTAGLEGGAFYVGEWSALNITGSGLLQIEGNTAQQGGGIYAKDNLTLNGNRLFLDNKAGIVPTLTYTYGDDIYMAGNGLGSSTLTLNANTGDIVFAKSVSNITADTSIFLEQNINVVLNLSGNRNIFLDSALKSVTTKGGNTLTLSGPGIVQFQGANVLNQYNQSGGSVTIGTNSIFRLAGANASFTTGGLSGALFNLNTGATLAGNGTIRVSSTGGINLRGTIAPDSAIFTSALHAAGQKLTVDESEKNGILTLIGGVNFNAITFRIDLGTNLLAGDKIKIENNAAILGTYANNGKGIFAGMSQFILGNTNGANGQYVIVEADNKLYLADGTTLLSDANLASVINFNTGSIGTGGRDTVILAVLNNAATDAGAGQIVINYNSSVLDLEWRGAGASDQWNSDATKQNWYDTVGARNVYFRDGDTVRFTTDGIAPSVTLAATRNVAAMFVSGGDYVFTDTSAGHTSKIQSTTGALTISGGSAEFALATDFALGTVLSGGAVIVAHNEALGVYDTVLNSKKGRVSVTGAASVTGKTGLIPVPVIKNRFEVASSGALTLGGLTVRGVDTSAASPAETGGAVYAQGNVTVTANTKFLNNDSSANGGAIYMDGVSAKTLTLQTGNNAALATSDIVFNGNGPTSGIYLTSQKTLSVTGSGKVYFGDAIATNAVTNNVFNVNMLDEKAFAIIKANSTIGGTVNVNTGNLFLANGTTLTGTNGVNVGTAGWLSGNGTIATTVGAIDVLGTIDPNSNAYSLNPANNIVLTSNKIGTLIFDGDTSFSGATLNMDIQDILAGSSDYIIVAGTLTAPTANTIVLTSYADGTYDIIEGIADLSSVLANFHVDAASTGGRRTATLQTKTGADHIIQVVGTSGDGAVLYWTGNNRQGGVNQVNQIWYANSAAVQNWSTSSTGTYGAESDFLDTKDYVVFTNGAYVLGTKTITVSGSPDVTGMEIRGGQYTFNGDKINGIVPGTSMGAADGSLKVGDGTTLGTTAIFDLELAFARKLIVDNATATLNVANSFGTGTDLTNGGTVILGDNAGLGVYTAGTVGTVNTVAGGTNSATVKIGADLTNVVNQFNAVTGTTLTFETDGHDATFAAPGSVNLANANLVFNTKKADDVLTFNSQVLGDATSTMTKLGTGLVVFKNAANTIGGTAALNGGMVQVNAGANLTVSNGITINGGGISGKGSVNSNTITITSGTLSAGEIAGEIGTLTLTSNVIMGNTTIVVDVTTAPKANDLIDINGNVTFVAATGTRENKVAVDIAGPTWVAGTYIIVTANSFAGADKAAILSHFALQHNGSDFGVRQNATLDMNMAMDELWLTLEEVGNIGIVWTGNNGYVWNTSAENWFAENDPTKAQLNFMGGDLVIFRNSEAKTRDIVVDASGVTVAGMVLENGSFTYEGGKITGAQNGSLGNGRLDIATLGTATATIKNATDFENGTKVFGNATILVANDKALGTTMVGTNRGLVNVASTGDLLVKANGGSRTLSNRFVVDAGGKLAMEGSSVANLTITNTVKATGNGGAVHSAGDLTVKGAVDFKGNSATGLGGAIYMGTGTKLALNASNGDITFMDNTVGLTNVANAVYLDNNASMEISGLYDVIFNDPITGGTGVSFVKNGTGRADFYGNSVFTSTTKAELNDGTIHLHNAGLNFGAANSATLNSFKINADGTLSGTGTVTAGGGINIAGKVSAGNGTVSVGTIALVGNTTFNGATLYTDLAVDGTADLIDVTGTVTYNGSNILAITSWVNNTTFDLVYSNLNGMTDPTGKWIIKIGERVISPGDRLTATLAKTSFGGQDILQLKTEGNNVGLIWNAAENRVWDSESENWKDNAGKKEIFMLGDAVTFNGLGTGNVFLANDATVSDMIVSAGNYTFTGATGATLIGTRTGSTIVGAKGELNITGGTSTFDIATDFAGDINLTGGTIITTANGSFKTDGDFVLGANATLDVMPKTHMIVADSVTLNGTVIVQKPQYFLPISNVIVANTALDTTNMSLLFDKSYGLNLQEALFSNSNKNMSLNFERLTVREFADLNGLDLNEKEAASGLDTVFAAGEPGWVDLHDLMYSFTEDAPVAYIIDNLRGTEMAANAIFSTLWDPWRNVFRNVDSIDKYNPATGTLGQAPKQLNGRNAWVEGFYRYMHASRDESARSYHVNHGGLMIGLDSQLGHFTTLGLSFGYSNPRLNSAFGKADTDDYTLALYGKTRLIGESYMLGYLGYGTQRYDFTRESLFGQNTAKVNGDALYTSFEFVKPVRWNQYVSLFPLAAFDYQRAWMGGFTEEGDFLAQVVEKSAMDRAKVRFGVNSKFRQSDRFNLTTRLQYSFMFAGDTNNAIKSTFRYSDASPTMTFRSIDMGRNQLNVGVGGETLLGKSKQLRLFLDYDFDCGEHRTAHTGEFGGSVVW